MKTQKIREGFDGEIKIFPIWYEVGGAIMQIHRETKDTLFIGNMHKWQTIKISRIKVGNGRLWLVGWKKMLHNHPYEFVKGQVTMTNSEMRDAFALENSSPRGLGEVMKKHFRLTTVEAGKYIRHKDYLNIPGPGSGLGNHTNASVFLSKEIKEAVSRLLPQ